ncbi:MAG TPA: alcohol dehydrogenase catalytic domain-containing protein [Candidatus Acidoferrales bacterium]|jgi:2-desacetyl-2-hydroxyethyl bacteriochlorophyllide A dehydrogenase|nr:alcohol dehydrogenase catalytic domain-containing protein [Candidatus Acidoferrales bacterium]
MKAMVLKAPGDLVLDEVARPPLGTGQVLIQVSHSGVCGTDLKIYNGAIPVNYPRIMGHEMIGEVVEGGGSFRPGARVIIDPELFCGACFHCRIGQTHLCPNGMLLGRDTNGGFAEYLTAPTSHVFPLPDSIDSRTAPLIQVLTTCLHAQRLTNTFPGESVAVLGLGVTGQLHVQLAKARGANPVIGITRNMAKRELAQTLGADLTVASGEGAIQKVLEATDGRGADLVIESTGVMASLADAVKMARSGGRLLLFGIITETEGALPFYQLYFKELSLINARVAKSEDYPGSINLVQRGIVRLEPLVSHVMPLGELKAAIGMLSANSGQRMKIILEHR